jgi:hypothetical protein
MQRAQLLNFLNIQLECVVACYTFWTAARSNQHVLSLWEFQWSGQASSSMRNFQLFKIKGDYLAQLEFQCNVRTFETFWAFLWSVWGAALSYTCMQLQEAIRTTKVFESCSGLARRPKQQFPGSFKFGLIFWHYFNARHTSLKLSEYSVGVCPGLPYLGL